MVIMLNIIVLAIIAFIIWWFWLYKPKTATLVTAGKVDVTVNNGVYTPDIIRTQVGKPLKINFLLKDEGHCAKTVIFSDFNVSQKLTLNKKQSITFTPNKTGEFEFTCPMGMYRGKLIVEKTKQGAVGSIDIIADGGVYVPSEIRSRAGDTIKLRFIRKDASHCANTVVFADFNIRQELPLNQPTEITLTPDKPAEYTFTCPMGMYSGKLIID